MPIIVNLSSVKILYIPSNHGISGSDKAFTALESKLPTLKGRKFYGLVYGSPPKETYWASVVQNSSEELVDGCKLGILPGGKYVQERIYDWEKNIGAIGKTFQRLIDENTVDRSRPFVEYYHGMNYMIVRVPVF